MRDLIARLEAATGPDRTLDRDIWLGLHGATLVEQKPGYFRFQRASGRGRWRSVKDSIAPTYTGSLDAALTLVPKGWAAHSMMIWPGNGTGLMLWGTHEFGGERWHGKDDPKVEARHMHAPIALCIAALRARLTMETPDDDRR